MGQHVGAPVVIDITDDDDDDDDGSDRDVVVASVTRGSGKGSGDVLVRSGSSGGSGSSEGRSEDRSSGQQRRGPPPLQMLQDCITAAETLASASSSSSSSSPVPVFRVRAVVSGIVSFDWRSGEGEFRMMVIVEDGEMSVNAMISEQLMEQSIAKVGERQEMNRRATLTLLVYPSLIAQTRTQTRSHAATQPRSHAATQTNVPDLDLE